MGTRHGNRPYATVRGLASVGVAGCTAAAALMALHAVALGVPDGTVQVPPSPPPSPPVSPGAASAAGGPQAPPVPQQAQPEQGFVWLFDGTTLNGWTGDTSGYAVEDGAIACAPSGRDLFTAREFGDFTLRLEFMLTPGANNGIALRAPPSGNASYEGIEVQVLDDAHPKYASIKSWQAHGSVYGVVPAKRGALKPPGEWNEQEIDLQGTRIRVTLNGTVIVDADLYRQAHDGTLDGQPHPGLRRTSGHIGFLGHGDRVLFRKIRIKESP